MLGIPGLDPFGLFHGVLGLAAVLLGLVVVLGRKGGRTHRRIGYAYVAVMVLMNVTALLIYDLFGRFGPFHWLALVSLVTTLAGFVPAWLRRPAGWLDIHARCMSWSYAGVVAAFAAEIGARVPGVRFVHGVVWPGLAVMVVAAVLIYGRVPRLVERTSGSSR
jgi:uncharacterized membrane protein